MRSSGSDKALFLGTLLILTVSSVGLKAATAPNNDDKLPAARVEKELVETLRRQGFSTSVRPGKFQSSIVFGSREGCRISARDASAGTSAMIVYARAAEDIGPVRYLYRGQSFDSPPMIRMRIGTFENEFLDRIGAHAPIAIPIALATSPQCGGKLFGLADVRIR